MSERATADRVARRTAVRALAAVVFAPAMFASVGAHAETAQEIVAKADKVRNPGLPFRNTTTLTEFVSGKPRSQSQLVVFSKMDPVSHQFRNLVRYVEPPRDAGKMVLLDGKNLWFYDPSSKSSVRISAQQRLIGQASVGDILTLNFAVDYAAALLADETITDADRQKAECWHIDLTAMSDAAIYNRIELWIERATYRPIKAKFYSDSGRLLKILYYRAFQQRLGTMRPGEAVILDAIDSALATTVQFNDPRFAEIPEAWFQRDYLPRLRAD